MNTPSLNRRRFLRGIGACLSLPAFEAMSGKAVGRRASHRHHGHRRSAAHGLHLFP